MTPVVSKLRFTPLRDLLRGRLTQRLDVEGVIVSSGLPAPAARCVREIVRRTGLWRLEKAEVAAELAAHFRDGLQAGTDLQTLLESFGDPSRTAKLIRRAVKRKRPLAWKAFRSGVLATVMLVVLYVGYGLYFLSGRPSPDTDYVGLLNAPIRAVPENERAWPRYRAALLQLEPLPEFRRWSRVPRPGESGWDEVASYLERQTGALALARDAATRPHLGFVLGHRIAPEDRLLWPRQAESADDPLLDESLVGVLLPYLSDLRQLARVLALDLQRAAAAGDGDTVLLDLDAMLSVADQVHEVPILINGLVASSIVTQAVESAGDALAHHGDTLSDAHLRRLAHRLAATDATLRLRLEGERFMFEDLVQRLYTDDGGGGGRLTLEGVRRLALLGPILDDDPLRAGLTGSGALDATLVPALSLVMRSRRDLLDDYDRLMSRYERAAEQPLWEIDLDAPESQLAEWKSSLVESLRRLPIVVLLPAFPKAIVNSEIAIGRRDALLAAIALELHRRRTGEWAGGLDDLVPDLVPAVPLDRFDGKPLRYVVKDGRPLLYSVGADRDDDGGAPSLDPSGLPNIAAAAGRQGRAAPAPPDCDWVLWPQPVPPIREW